MVNKIQRIYVVAFIIHKNKLLIVKRSSQSKFLPGYYELPGGKIEFGEELEDALKREIKEELNVSIKVLEPYHLFSFFSSNKEFQGIEVCFFAKLIDRPNKIKLNEHEDLKWISKKELDSYKISKKEKDSMIKGFQKISYKH